MAPFGKPAEVTQNSAGLHVDFGALSSDHRVVFGSLTPPSQVLLDYFRAYLCPLKHLLVLTEGKGIGERNVTPGIPVARHWEPGKLYLFLFQVRMAYIQLGIDYRCFSYDLAGRHMTLKNLYFRSPYHSRCLTHQSICFHNNSAFQSHKLNGIASSLPLSCIPSPYQTLVLIALSNQNLFRSPAIFKIIS